MRNYDIEADIAPIVGPDQIQVAHGILEEHYMSVDGHFIHDDNAHLYYGTIELGGGRSTEEAHDAILANLQDRFPGVRLSTRWRCTDDLPWDEEHGSTEEY